MKPNRGFGGWQKMHRSTDRTYADKAIAAHICRGCMAWHSGAKPAACTTCGRMDFESFQSQGEAKWWMKLLRRQESGQISGLERQHRIDLLTVHHRTGKPVVFATYVADFRWKDTATGELVVAECKPGAAMTYESQLKIRCVESMGIPIEMLT